MDLSVELNAAALEVLRSSIEQAAEEAKEAVRAQLLRELDAEEEVRACSSHSFWDPQDGNAGCIAGLHPTSICVVQRLPRSC